MSKTSTMSVVPWIRIQFSEKKGNGQGSFKKDYSKVKRVLEDGTHVTNKIRVYVFVSGKIYRKESISEAMSMIGIKFEGNRYKKFKELGYHRFKDPNRFMFIEKDKLPEDLLKIVESLEE